MLKKNVIFISSVNFSVFSILGENEYEIDYVLLIILELKRGTSFTSILPFPTIFSCLNGPGGGGASSGPSSAGFEALLAKHSSHKRRRRNRKNAPVVPDTAKGIDSENFQFQGFCKNSEHCEKRGHYWLHLLQKGIRTSKVGSLLLVVEDIPHEEVWREWIEQSESSKYGVRVYIHAKFPERLRSPWMKERLIRDSKGDIINFKPNWGQIEVTRALLRLFEIALQDDDVERLAYVSESCIPVTTFADAAKALWEDNINEKSWLAAYQKPVDGYDSMMMNAVDTKVIPKECVYKCDTWVMLTRKHAHAVLMWTCQNKLVVHFGHTSLV